MATSYTRYSGGNYSTSAIYTVPSGKISKIIVNYFMISNSYTIRIGDYDRKNASGSTLRSDYGSGSPPTSNVSWDTQGMMVCRSNDNSFAGSFLVLKTEHILVPTQTIAFSGSGSNLIDFLVIEEDQ